MKRQLLSALGALALGWWTGAVAAEERPTLTFEPAQAKDAKAVDAAPAVMNEHGDNCKRGRFEAGGTFYYLKPHWAINPAFSVADGNAAPPTVFTGVNFSWDYEPAFGVWAGYTSNSGLGFRARYFRFDNDVGQDVVNDGTLNIQSASTGANNSNTSTTAGDVLSFASRLNVQSVDAEITQEWRNSSWSLVLGGGFRYAYMSQSYAHREVPVGGVDVDAIAIGHNFTGWGMTGSLDARRTLGDTNVTLFGATRGALVWGTWRQNDFNLVNDVVDERGVITQDRFMPVLEMELGAEWSRAIGRTRLLVAGGATGQVWFNAGNASNNDHFNTVDDGHNSESNLGLLGFFVRAGIRY